MFFFEHRIITQIQNANKLSSFSSIVSVRQASAILFLGQLHFGPETLSKG
jgi:hypothetical protein